MNLSKKSDNFHINFCTKLDHFLKTGLSAIYGWRGHSLGGWQRLCTLGNDGCTTFWNAPGQYILAKVSIFRFEFNRSRPSNKRTGCLLETEKKSHHAFFQLKVSWFWNVFFGVFNSSNKRTKNFCPSRLGQKLKFLGSFFGRIEDTKMSFRNLPTPTYFFYFK